MSVSLQEVERVAELASLELAEDEKPRMQRDLNAILEYVAQLNSLDTSAVEPLAQVSELLDAGAAAAVFETRAMARRCARMRSALALIARW